MFKISLLTKSSSLCKFLEEKLIDRVVATLHEPAGDVITRIK